MKQVYLKLLGNLFDDPKITVKRFRNFCIFVLTAMKATNADGRYDAFMQKIKALIEALKKEMSSLDSGVTSQISNTSDVDVFIDSFGEYMKKTAGAIAYALGGDTTSAFFDFYPHQIREYRRANKTTMPDLTLRVFNAATKHAEALGTRLAGELQSFAGGYEAILEKQQLQITNVNTDRKERNTAFTEGQWIMTGIVHEVAALNNRNPEAMQKLFPFERLFPHNGQHPVYLKGALEAAETRELMNRSLTAEVTVDIKNESVNARIMVWLAALPDAPAPETGIIIEANKKSKVTADKLGDLSGTFLMVKNLSDVNKASYTIGVLGIKKDGSNGEGNIKSVSLKIAS